MWTVVEGVIAQWVSVDMKGNIYFTDQETNSVNKLPIEVINLIVKDEVMAKDLKVTTEPEAEGEEAAKESMEEEFDGNATAMAESLAKTTVVTTPTPAIYQLYQKGVSDNVGTPAGIVASGSQLFWSNQVGGFSHGSVCEGKTSPRVKQSPGGDNVADANGDQAASADQAASGGEEESKPSFPSFRLANNSGSTYGVALTASKIIFSDTAHNVYAMSRGTQETVPLTTGLSKP